MNVESEPPMEWAVDDWMPLGESYILSGISNLGKSYLRFDLEISLASGEPWLGKFGVKRMPVYVLDFENPRHYVKRSMVDDICKARGIPLQRIERWHFISHRKQLLERHDGFDVESTIRNIEAIKQRTGEPRGIFIVDSMRQAFGGLEGFEGEWDWRSHSVREVSRRIYRVMDATNWGFLGVHHDGKGQTGPSGSGDWQGAFDSILHYTGNPFSDKPRNLEFAGRLNPAPEPIAVRMVDGALKGSGRNGKDSRILEFLREHPDGKTKKGIQKGVGGDSSTIAVALKRMETAGEVEQTKGMVAGIERTLWRRIR